jgi:lycopene cyclase CruA
MMPGTEQATIFARLRGRYPQTVAAFAAMPGGEQALAAVERLDERFAAVVRGVAADEVVIPCDALPTATHGTYDVVYFGGVLGLINATALAVGAARDGQPLRIALLDEGKAGNAHREWNISLAELAEIVYAGVATWEDLAGIVANRYRAGILRFHAETIDVPAAPMMTEAVLDVAVRADALLAHCRRRFTECGGVIHEGRRFLRCYQRTRGCAGSVIEVEGPDGLERYGARLVVDAMGTISPVAWAINQGGALQGVCPTAGTTARGFRRGSDPRAVDPATGEVLITIADVQEGRQLIWEGFPAGEDEYTVYLFYYDRIDPARPQSLLDLFERYFALLPTYKEPGAGFAHLKPVYGFIPARYHDVRRGTGAARGIVSIGDAAAQQSPLTFCGFGSHTRNLRRITAMLHYCLAHDLLEAKHLRHAGAHQANMAPLWGLSRMMAHRDGGDPAAVNRIMNVFLATLNDLGAETTRRFLRDNPSWPEYTAMMLATLRRQPWVLPALRRALGTRGLMQWFGDYGRFGLLALGRAALGDPLHGWRARFAEQIAHPLPAAGLALRARQWEYRSMRGATEPVDAPSGFPYAGIAPPPAPPRSGEG